MFSAAHVISKYVHFDWVSVFIYCRYRSVIAKLIKAADATLHLINYSRVEANGHFRRDTA
jgi:hypothetical protein